MLLKNINMDFLANNKTLFDTVFPGKMSVWFIAFGNQTGIFPTFFNYISTVDSKTPHTFPPLVLCVLLASSQRCMNLVGAPSEGAHPTMTGRHMTVKLKLAVLLLLFTSLNIVLLLSPPDTVRILIAVQRPAIWVIFLLFHKAFLYRLHNTVIIFLTYSSWQKKDGCREK